MKKIVLFTLLLLPLMESRAQYVKIDNGLMTTAYVDPIGLGIIDGRNTHYAVNLGIDYMEKNASIYLLK